jgi:DNA mismatch repair protein MutS
LPCCRSSSVCRGCSAPRLLDIDNRIDEVAEARDRILAAIADAPPLRWPDGGVIRDGFDASLDQLRDISSNSRQYIAAIEAPGTGANRYPIAEGPLQQRLRIQHRGLQSQPAPGARVRAQTNVVNAERFTTPELKELESKILDAEEKILEIERRIFNELRAARRPLCAARIRATALAVAELDVAAALAQAAWKTAIAARAFHLRRKCASPPGVIR